MAVYWILQRKREQIKLCFLNGSTAALSILIFFFCLTSGFFLFHGFQLHTKEVTFFKFRRYFIYNIFMAA